jgi:hypothetical protein
MRRLTLAILVLSVLAACADLAPRPPYVGEFTGEYVDGKPLYRFPAIEVIGRR